MSGSSDILYGRRGGSWRAKQATRSTTPAPDKADEACKICGKLYAAHSGQICPLCGRSVEHHADGDVEFELEARARMATARQAAGLKLSTLDLEAIELYPNPRGYAGT